jgi:hypothetical protein
MPYRSLTPAKYAQQFTHEHVKFDDGDHVIVHSTPGGVQITGYLDGEWIEYAGSARDAAEQARLIETSAPDALWAMDRERARRIASAIDGAVVAATLDAIPEADSPEDVTEDEVHEKHERVALDGGHADVDVFTDRIEVTIRLGGRSVLGIALSHMEAANLGRAISSPDGATTGDLFHVADTLGVNAGDIMRLQNRAVNA